MIDLSPFDRIIADRGDHTYTLDGQPLTSVTALIKQIQRPFDAPAAATRAAARRGIPMDEILAEWEASRIASQERGTRVHSYIERATRHEGASPEVQNDVGARLPEMDAFDGFWEQASPRVAVAASELVIGDAALGVAGTVDAVLWHDKTQRFHVWDWKTGKRFRTSNDWDRLLVPFESEQDCELICYSLQTSLYRLIIERQTSIELGESYILHLSPEGTRTIHTAQDFRAPLEEWLSTQPKHLT